MLFVSLPLGVWLGVEWDDVSRGKHSGDHEGVHYFTCRSEPTFSNKQLRILCDVYSLITLISREGSGSFVRPKKISLGCTFIEAVQEVHTCMVYFVHSDYIMLKLWASLYMCAILPVHKCLYFLFSNGAPPSNCKCFFVGTL